MAKVLSFPHGEELSISAAKTIKKEKVEIVVKFQ